MDDWLRSIQASAKQVLGKKVSTIAAAFMGFSPDVVPHLALAVKLYAYFFSIATRMRHRRNLIVSHDL